MTAPESNPELDAKISRAYRQALQGGHQSGRIQIHIGSEVLDYLKTLADVPSAEPLPLTEAYLFGFPLIRADEKLSADHVSVHVVYHIL